MTHDANTISVVFLREEKFSYLTAGMELQPDCGVTRQSFNLENPIVEASMVKSLYKKKQPVLVNFITSNKETRYETQAKLYALPVCK